MRQAVIQAVIGETIVYQVGRAFRQLLVISSGKELLQKTPVIDDVALTLARVNFYQYMRTMASVQE